MTAMTSTGGQANLQALMDRIPVRLFEKARFWLHRNAPAQTSCAATFQRGRCDLARITVTRPA